MNKECVDVVCYRGVVKLDFDMSKWNLNQCGKPNTSDTTDKFAGTHKCHNSTQVSQSQAVDGEL